MIHVNCHDFMCPLAFYSITHTQLAQLELIVICYHQLLFLFQFGNSAWLLMTIPLSYGHHPRQDKILTWEYIGNE
jgi:hypothetical protein